MSLELPSEHEVAAAAAKWRDADPRFERLFARYGKLAPAARHYGLVLWQAGELKTAAVALRCAVSLAPESVESWNDLAGVLEAAGETQAARACLEESLARDQHQSQTWLQVAMLRAGFGDDAGSEAAYLRAIELDPASVHAFFGLGIFYFNAKRYADAVTPLRTCITLDPVANPAAFACLGQALYYTGDFAGSAAGFAEAVRLYPDNRIIWLKWVRAQFAADVISGDVEAAIQTCRDRAGLTDAEFKQTLQQGFHVLSAYGRRDAAIRLGTARLARDPDDPVQAYLLAALKGEPLARAPDDYIVAYFDHFAAGFDQQLVDILDYRGPEILKSMIERTGHAMPAILDLGCGTGLAGPLFARAGRRLTGIDLSPRMLDAARARGTYEELVHAEALAYLDDKIAAYDLILAADLLVYIGDLAPLFESVGRALAPGGLLALTIETTNSAFALQPSGRFAHAIDYVMELANRQSLALVEMREGTIRLEAGLPLRGAYMLFRRT